MNCKKCGAELVEGQPFCPSCGADNRESAGQEPVMYGPEILEEKKKMSGGRIACIVAAVVVMLAVLVSIVMIGMKPSENGNETTAGTTDTTEADPTIPTDGNPGDETCKGTYTVTDEEAKAQNGTVVATWGDRKLTNGQLQVEYWLTVYNFLEYYGSYAYYYFGMDYTQPLDMQATSLGNTWQQLFLSQALQSWQQYVALADAAEKAGYELPEEYRTKLESMEADLEAQAAEYEYESAEAMLQAEMGPGCTLKDYLAYMKTYYTGYLYYLSEGDKLTATEDEINAYFEEHKAEFAEEGVTENYLMYNVRHILLQPSEEGTSATWTEDQWAACLAEAEAMLENWKTGDGTEEGFAKLANEHSADGDGTGGGLYTGLTDDTNFVTEFKEWYLDGSRQVGDTGIVKSVYGYHIMYFSDSYTFAESELLSEKLNKFIESTMAANELVVDYSAIVLGNVDLSDGE